MRKTSRIESGEYTRRYGSVGTFLPEQEVRVVGPRDRNGNENDEWIVTPATDSREFVVPGDALTPHPEEAESNVEALARLLNFSPSGALMHGFVFQAIQTYAAQVMTMPQDQRDQMDKTMIPYAPWERCASDALTLVTEHLAGRR